MARHTFRDIGGRFKGGVLDAFMSDRESRMGWRSVSSSNVAAVGYDEDTMTMGVRFLNGSEYEYYSVPRDTYDALVNATSVGKFLHYYVKGHYVFERTR